MGDAVTRPIEATGLLVAGRLVDVPGLTIWAPASHGGPAYARLDAGDYAMRPSTLVQQIILHTTGGLWPQPVHDGAGPAGHAREILDMWSGADRDGGERVHSAAQLVVDFDGSIVCAADLVYAAAYHAEGSNRYSVGIEMCTLPNGGIYKATLHATVALVRALTGSGGKTGILPIPFQGPRGPYLNRPIRRMETGEGAARHQLGGPDCVGVFGHRDNTSERGFGDPGDAIWDLMPDVETFDYDLGEDLAAGRQRQITLNALDAQAGNTWRPLVIDGVCGPASLQAMHRWGFARWADVRKHA
jgi:hypothetical protein